MFQKLWRPSDLTKGVQKGGVIPGSGLHVGSMASWDWAKKEHGGSEYDRAESMVGVGH